eukprot:8273-Heterococcus_DN1.PRE.4
MLIVNISCNLALHALPVITQAGAALIKSVTFDDVEGVDSAKEELAEVVDFLQDSARYEAIGARLPKGILLSGPSGTVHTAKWHTLLCTMHITQCADLECRCYYFASITYALTRTTR